MALQTASRRVARRLPQQSAAISKRVGAGPRSQPVRDPLSAVHSGSRPLMKRHGLRTPAARKGVVRKLGGNISNVVRLGEKYASAGVRFWSGLGPPKRKQPMRRVK